MNMPATSPPAWTEQHPWAWPSWVGSFLVHAVCLLLLAWLMPQHQPLGHIGEADREVGLSTQQSPFDTEVTQGEVVDVPDPQMQTRTPETAGTQTRDPINPVVADERPPVALDLPDAGVARLGPGPLVAGSQTADDARNVTRGGSPKPGQMLPGAKTGGTRFFDAQANGSRFVYVMDASGSMTNHNAIAIAKAELIASLEQLESTQQFQIIFYNVKPVPMPSQQLGQKEGLMFATEIHRNRARQFIRGVQPDSGTNHLDAVMLALRYNPDVMFFLTDAADPELSAADLNLIAKRNNGKTQIHTVEFGIGADLGIDNFLKKLARQNRGSHSYRDVTKFSKTTVLPD